MNARTLLVAGLFFAVLFVSALLYVRGRVRRAFYPLPAAMPEVVQQSMEELLLEYEAHLAKHAPDLLTGFQSGLTKEEVASLEKQYHCVLTEDLRALYGWRNGSSSYEIEFVPGRQFIPLEKALEARELRASEVKSGTLVSRAAYAVLAGHRRAWIGVATDAGGDGYFYDPERRGLEGSFFFNFLEDGSYVYFPNVKNFVAGVNECFEKGIFKATNNGRLKEDFARSQSVWQKYGGSNVRF